MGKLQLKKKISNLEKRYNQLSLLNSDDEQSRDKLMDKRIKTLHQMVTLKQQLVTKMNS